LIVPDQKKKLIVDIWNTKYHGDHMNRNLELIDDKIITYYDFFLKELIMIFEMQLNVRW